jgi:hypothetical protein
MLLLTAPNLPQRSACENCPLPALISPYDPLLTRQVAPKNLSSEAKATDLSQSYMSQAGMCCRNLKMRILQNKLHQGRPAKKKCCMAYFTKLYILLSVFMCTVIYMQHNTQRLYFQYLWISAEYQWQHKCEGLF